MIKEATKTRKGRRYVKYAIKEKQLEVLELLPVTNATKVHLKGKKLIIIIIIIIIIITTTVY